MNKAFFKELINQQEHAVGRLRAINEEIYGRAPESAVCDAAKVEHSIQDLMAQSMNLVGEIHSQLNTLDDAIRTK